MPLQQTFAFAEEPPAKALSPEKPSNRRKRNSADAPDSSMAPATSVAPAVSGLPGSSPDGPSSSSELGSSSDLLTQLRRQARCVLGDTHFLSDTDFSSDTEDVGPMPLPLGGDANREVSGAARGPRYVKESAAGPDGSRRAATKGLIDGGLSPEFDGRRQTAARCSISTGSSTLDAWLPQGGLPKDGITQCIAGGNASVAGAFSLIAVAGHMRNPEGHGPVVVVARDHEFYPPAAAAMGIPLDRLIWVRPSCRRDAIWAMDQALRCRSVAGVWAPVDERLDSRDARRLQLAAETGATPAFWVRPAAAVENRLNFASVSFRVELCPWRAPDDPSASTISWDSLVSLASPVVRVSLDRCRGRVGSAETHLQITPSGQLTDVDSSLLRWIDGQDAIDRSTPPLAPAGQPHAAAPAVSLAAQLAHPTSKAAAAAERRRASNCDKRRRA